MGITISKNPDIQKWNELLSVNSFTTPFQSPDFLFLNQALDGRSAEVYAVNENEKIIALCIVTLQKENGFKGYFSRRAIVYGGPLLEENSHKHLKELLNAIHRDLKKRAIYIEIRNLSDYASFSTTFSECGWKYLPYLNIQLLLQNKSMNDILSAMNYNRRREIRISQEEGAEYAEASSIDEVEKLYIILKELYKKRVKLPLPHFDFFRKIFSSPSGKIFIVKHNGQVIGGSFCLFGRDKSVHTLYYCGDREYHKKIFPTHLAILAAIEFGKKNKLKYLDFMGAGKPGEEYGVRNYKEGFGGNTLEHGRYIKVCKPFLYQIGKMGIKLIRK